MRFIFTQDNLAKLTPAVRPIVKDGKMVGVEKVAVPKQYIVYDAGANVAPGFGMYVGARRKTFVLQTRVGPRVTKVLLLGCHLHGSMRGHVFVTDSAWTLKTDADGIARFTAVPDGAAQLRVWHSEQLVDLPRKNLQVQPTPVLDTMQLSVVPRPRRPLPASAPAPARAGSAPHIHY